MLGKELGTLFVGWVLEPDGTLETPPSVHFYCLGFPLGLLGELPPSPAP